MKHIAMGFLAALLLLTGCARTAGPEKSANEPDTVSAATEQRYREGEAREYRGARLDPAVGLRDNSITGVQHVDINGYTLTIDGLVNSPVSLTYDQVKALPAYERLIALHCVEGWDATVLWKGALLTDLIAKAGAKPGAVTVIFTAADGYTTSLPLKAIQDKRLILAYQANGLALPPELGYPFIVVAEDKYGYKWARWVNRITLSDDPNYLGYWEQRGYSNDAGIRPNG